MNKKDLSAESKDAIEAAIAKNKVVLAETNKLLADKSLAQEQVDAQLNRLNESIQAVYDELKRNGIGRDGKFSVALSANEGYTAASTELRKENGEFLGSTGKSYKVLDGNANYKVYVHGYQSENTDVPAANSGQAGISGRTDIPLSKTEAQKLGREAALWKGKIRATGKTNGNSIWGAGGAYEYLATEIYGYTYEQGNHYVYLTDVKKRFSLSPEATAAGYTITNIALSNLLPGLAYNETTDTVEGYVASTLQNGVYDMRYVVTVAKDGATQQVTFRDLTAGWIGWQDTSAPVIQGSSKLVTIGDQVNHNIKYVDNDGMTRDERADYAYTTGGDKVVAGSKTAPGKTGGATFTAVDGSKIRTENGPQTVTAHTALNGVYTGSKTSINDVVPGLNYNPQTGDITGTATEAGIFTAATYAKDYNNTTNARNMDWNMYGQEAHENITIAVAPKITVKNVEAYATNVPVTISKGANKAEITMPDGTVTKLVVKDGNWIVAAGTTNTAVQEGAVLAAASTTGDSTLNLTVTPESTKYVGVDSIAAKATTDKVKANIQREFAMVTDAAGNTLKAEFNHATGKYSLPTEKAYELKDNGNGTSTLIERRVYTDAQANGDVKFVVYEFERTWNATSSAPTLVDKIAEIRKNGEVTAVGNVTRTETLVKKDNTSSEQGMVVTVSYDSVTNQWTSSDGTAVTAKESNAGWEVETASGFKGYVSYREASSTDVASIQNAKPAGTSTSYSEAKDASVDLLKSSKANVDFTDTIDDKSDAAQSETIKTKLTVTAPDGSQKVFDAAKAEEAAYIAAQRTAAEKTKAAAEAVENAQGAANELARLQELLDRQTRIADDAQKALDNLKLRSISPTAQELAERKLANVKEFKASIESQLATAQANLSTKNTEVESTRTAALEAEKAVETARAALKTAAAANLANPEIAAYTLGQYGSYKVTVRAVDSNGVVTTPTVGGTDSGEVTEDAVAETTYYIVVPKPEISGGAQDTPQSDTMEKGFKTGLPESSTVSDYKLVDPATGEKKDSVTTDEGTYTVDSTTGKVTFTPAQGYVGTAKPLTVAANVTIPGDDGKPVTVEASTTYTPTVYGVKGNDDTTKDVQGAVQTSKPGSERFSKLNTPENTPDGTNVDLTTAKYSLEGADNEGKVVVPNEGTYTIDPTTGVVTFTPLPTFTGTAQGVDVKVTANATDKEGAIVEVTATGKYTPVVEPVKPTAEAATSTDVQGATQEQPVTFNDSKTTIDGVEKKVPIDPTTYTLLDENGQPASEVPAKDASGKVVGTYTVKNVDGKAVAVFTPTDKTYVGKVEPVTVQAKDKNGTPARGEYTAVVHPVTPTGWDVISADIQGQEQNGKPKFKGGTVEIGGEEKKVDIDENVAPVLLDPATKQPVAVGTPITVKGEGVYTLQPDGTVNFVPEKTFVGEAKGVIVQRVDKLGQPAIGKYRPIVIGAKPKAQPATSQDVQGQVQKQPVTFIDSVVDKTTVPDIDIPDVKVAVQKTVPIDPATYTLLDENGQPATKVPAKDPEGNVIGEYTLEVVDGKAIGVLTPNATYYGAVQPVRVQAADKNGITVETTYTPYITPVTPTATPATSEGIQGKTQEGTPTFTEGDKKVPINLDKAPKLVDPTTGKPTEEKSVKVPNEGTYEIDENGKVTFTPEPNFTGQAKGIEVQREDKNGTPVNGKYTPFVKPVTPKGDEKETQDIQGAPQKSTPTFTGGKTTVNGKEETVEINYEKPAKLVDPTTGKPTDETTVKVPNEGTYTIDPKTGEVTFTPEPNFTGKTSGIKVQREDKNGTPATATYTPTVVPVTPTVVGVTPTGKEAKSKDLQGETQTGKPTFTGGKTTVNGKEETVEIDNDKPATFEDGSTTKVVPNEGTYTVAPDGTVTFVPEQKFTGVATGVTVKRVDKNGTPVTATYTPTVIPVSPSGEDVTSVGPKNTPQEGTPIFKGGSETLDGKKKTVEIDKDVPATFEDGKTTKVVPGEGTYTVDKDGKVIFTPERDFVGVTKGVTVKRVDKNGTPVTATYTPTVLGATSTKDVVSEGPKGKPQSNTPVFEGDVDKDVPPTFEDGKTTKVVPGEGTYTIDPNGKVTFTPEPDFVGTTNGVTVVRKDKNGKAISATYTPTVRPETIFRDKEGKEIPNYPSEDGTTPKKDIPGYRFVETKTLPNGDTEHVYEKVKTSFKDKDGNEIPNYPSEDGTTPKKDIPGYRFVETKTLPNGDTEHVYEKVKTSFKDKDGNEIPNYPSEDGTTPKKDIPGYRFVETKTLPNGDTEHVYEKVKTSFKDKDGNEIPNYPTEDGEQPKKDIPGYRFVETKKLPNGDIEHVYEKVSTPAPTPSPVPQPTPGKQNTTTWTDENGNPLKPTEPGSKEPGTVSGYEYVKTVTDPNGNIKHIFKKVEMPTSRPVEPSQPATPKYVEGQKELPNTGTEDNNSLAALGLLGVLSGFGLVARKKKED